MGNKHKVAKKESSLITSNISATKPRKVVVFTAVLIVVMAVGIILYFASGYDIKSITSPNCSNDSDLIGRYNTALQNTASNDEYAKINEIILNKIKYQGDITCTYILFNSYLKFGDFIKAGDEYMNIKTLYESNRDIPAGIFNEQVDINGLLEEFKYFDTEASPEETGEVWG